MNITVFGIFLEGLLSFLSPCVLPLLPLYMGYLAGEDKVVDENGNTKYKTGKVFVTTLFFALGICFTLTLFAISVNVISNILDDYKEIISIICGTVLVVFGLHELGVIHIDVLDSDSRFKVNLHLDKMNFIKAFLLGFVFSLGWSPCIGPMLTNALMLVASSNGGYVYIIAYGLGLVVPFLLTGLLTSSILNFINSKKNIMKWVLKVAGIIMICFGIYMISTGSNNIIEYKQKTTDTVKYLIEHKFENQDGKPIRLKDYRDKYVIINFTTTWCTYCNSEIPDYMTFAKQHDDVKCLYVMSPSTSRCSKEELVKYIDENFECDVIIDENNELASYCGITGYPSKLFISKDSEFLGIQSGQLNVEMLEALLAQCKTLEK